MTMLRFSGMPEGNWIGCFMPQKSRLWVDAVGENDWRDLQSVGFRVL